MFQVRKGGQADWHTADPDKVAAFILNQCGGGYTVAQTAKAIETNHAIMNGNVYKTASGIEIRWAA